MKAEIIITQGRRGYYLQNGRGTAVGPYSEKKAIALQEKLWLPYGVGARLGKGYTDEEREVYESLTQKKG